MLKNKKWVILAALALVGSLLMAAPSATAHPDDDCHHPFTPGFEHTIEEGETLCFFYVAGQATPGLLNNAIQGSQNLVSIIDSDGIPVVEYEDGEWGPIQKIDATLYGCPMPTVAIARWEYSPTDLQLEPGEYTVLFDAVFERPILDGFHMCDEPPLGPASFVMPEDSYTLPVALTVEAAAE